MRDHTPKTPLTAEALVSDETLVRLGNGGPERERGEITPEDLAALVMILPEITGELLAHRHRARLATLAPAVGHVVDLAAARQARRALAPCPDGAA